jgi:hypothetical protein
MAVLIDIISATVIGGMILLLVITVTDSGIRQFFNYNADAIIQNQLAHIAYITEYDLRKMGCGIHEVFQGTILQVAQANHIKYLSQLNFQTDNIPDTIEYKITAAETIDYGDTSLTLYNLTRIVKISSQSPQSITIGKIGNSNVFKYLDQIGNPAPIIQATKMVEVTLVTYNPAVVLSPEFVNTELDSVTRAAVRKKELQRLLRPSFWRQTRLVSKNLRR